MSGNGVEGERADRAALVPDRHDECAAGADRGRKLHLQAPLLGHVVHHERAPLGHEHLVEVVGDVDQERPPELLRDAARRGCAEHAPLRVVEEQHCGVCADGGGGRRQNVATDLLHRPGLRAQPGDRADDLQLADALRAGGGPPQALPAAACGEGDPDGGRERGHDDREGDERGRSRPPSVLTRPWRR